MMFRDVERLAFVSTGLPFGLRVSWKTVLFTYNTYEIDGWHNPVSLSCHGHRDREVREQPHFLSWT